MERLFFERNLKTLSMQRNFLVATQVGLILLLFGLAGLLFFKNERVVVVPGLVEKEFWVDAHSVSATYLEQFGVFLGQSLLTKSPHSADLQRVILCRHADPRYWGLLKQRLVQEEETLKKQNASYVFFLNHVFVDPSLLTVRLVGDRQFFVAGQPLSSEECSYKLHFTYTGGRLLLQEIVQEKDSSIWKGDV